MHLRITQVLLRVDFFVEREAATIDRDTGAQQLPALVSREIRPVNHQQNVRKTLNPAPRQCALDVPTCAFHVRIAKQPIHALDAVLQARRTT